MITARQTRLTSIEMDHYRQIMFQHLVELKNLMDRL